MRIPVLFAKRLRPLAVLLAGLLVLPASMAQNAPALRSRLAVLHEAARRVYTRWSAQWVRPPHAVRVGG